VLVVLALIELGMKYEDAVELIRRWLYPSAWHYLWPAKNQKFDFFDLYHDLY